MRGGEGSCCGCRAEAKKRRTYPAQPAPSEMLRRMRSGTATICPVSNTGRYWAGAAMRGTFTSFMVRKRGGAVTFRLLPISSCTRPQRSSATRSIGLRNEAETTPLGGARSADCSGALARKMRASFECPPREYDTLSYDLAAAAVAVGNAISVFKAGLRLFHSYPATDGGPSLLCSCASVCPNSAILDRLPAVATDLQS